MEYSDSTAHSQRKHFRFHFPNSPQRDLTLRPSQSSNRPKTILQLLNSHRQRSRQGHCQTEDNNIQPRRSPEPSGRCIYVLVDRKSIEVQVTGRQMKGLLEDVRKVLGGRGTKLLGLASTNGDMRLDYYLSCEQASVSQLGAARLELRPLWATDCNTQGQVDLTSFEILRAIGTGGFSRVFLVRFREDGRFYAMKVIDKFFIVKNRKKRIVQNERNIMVSNCHPLLAKLYFAFETRSQIILVMQYYPGGELFSQVKKLRRMSQSVARFYMIEILLALQHLHKAGVIYRDFKPQNILLDRKGHAHIADFGLAKPGFDSKKDRAHSFCGSPEYMPPEMVAKTGHSLPADFYSLGAVLYELVTGLPPFYDKDPNKIYEATLHQSLYFPKHSSDMSPQLKHLLTRLLCKNQEDRLGKGGVKQVLAHPWFGKVQKKEFLEKKVIPPVGFEHLEDLRFNSEQMKIENDRLMRQILEEQRDQGAFSKVMGNFYYDWRTNNLSQPLSAPENTLKLKKGSSARLLQTCGSKIRKDPYAKLNSTNCQSIDRIFRVIDNLY